MASETDWDPRLQAIYTAQPISRQAIHEYHTTSARVVSGDEPSFACIVKAGASDST